MDSIKWLILALMILTREEALGILPNTLALKPYQIKASAAFGDCISFQEIPGKPGVFVVVQKNGSLVYYEPKTGKTAPWVKIKVNTAYEEGLYAVAFHPDFEKNGRYFALYSPESNASVPSLNYGHPGQYLEALVEYTADANHEKDSGLPPKLIAEFCCKDGPGHNGMFPVFGKDRLLYISFGDGNSDGRETQAKHSFLGTILRLDIDHADPGKNYAIPKDNPFISDPDPAVKKEIWAYGFRNNFNLSVDALTGDIWVGNVGGWNEDHVSLVRKGNNFGWPITEGSVCFDNSKSMFQYTAPLSTCDRTGIIPPTISLPHSLPRGNVNTNCVIGPVVYRGNPNSPLYGVVFYADYTAQKLMAARLDNKGNITEQKEYLKTNFQIVHLHESTDGRILVSGLSSSQFFYLDDPGLLMGSASDIRTQVRKHASVRFNRGDQAFTVSGRRSLGGNSFQGFQRAIQF